MAEGWKVWEGTTIDGKFRLDEYLGGSEHSAVFRTQVSGDAAAIKFVPATAANLDLQSSGWEAASRFTHPHLLRLFGTGRCRLGDTDLLYLVMEFAEENLGQIVPQRALTAEEVRQILPPMLDALTYLHQAGFGHAALKPSNILAAHDQLKLSSDQVRPLGKAQAAREATLYDAPELASSSVTAASDVYALGAVLVEGLTQRPPGREAASASQTLAEIPDPLREIVAHCLDADPDKRWTVAGIAQRLRGEEPLAGAVPTIEAAKPVSSQAVPDRVAAPAPAREFVALEKSPGRRLLITGISFLLVLFAIYAGFRWFHGSDAATIPSERHADAEPAAADAAGVAPSKAGEPKPAKAPAKTDDAGSPSAGRVVERVEPDVSASARATIQGKIRVRVGVTVDPSGNVTNAKLLSAGPSQYFASRALTAAQKWKFTPSQVNGQPAPAQWTLLFGFTRKGTNVDAEQTVP